MDLPSGLHRKFALTVPIVVSRRGAPPPADTIQMSERLAWLETNAMSSLVGDHRGALSPLGQSVNCVGAPPAVGTTQMSELPERFEVKAMRLPSGDHVGSTSAP